MLYSISYLPLHGLIPSISGIISIFLVIFDIMDCTFMNLHRILLFGMITTNAAPSASVTPKLVYTFHFKMITILHLIDNILCHHGWIYLSFQDDNHQMDYRTIAPQSWIYLSFQDDNHPGFLAPSISKSWIVPFIQDDNHPGFLALSISRVGYTFHFKMITTHHL